MAICRKDVATIRVPVCRLLLLTLLLLQARDKCVSSTSHRTVQARFMSSCVGRQSLPLTFCSYGLGSSHGLLHRALTGRLQRQSRAKLTRTFKRRSCFSSSLKRFNRASSSSDLRNCFLSPSSSFFSSFFFFTRAFRASILAKPMVRIRSECLC